LKRSGISGFVALMAVVLVAGSAYGHAAEVGLESALGKGLDVHYQAAQVPGMPDYDWWYGCSPTAAGMVLGKYDRDGYGADTDYYANIAPGGDAETRLDAGVADPRASYPFATSMIASSGHAQDFYPDYVNGYGAYGDDNTGMVHTFDCLADFMGTSQDDIYWEGSPDPHSNSNGATTFFYRSDGSRLHYYDLPGLYAYGYSLEDASGMYGIYEYLAYRGYGADVVDIYNQYIVEEGLEYGFSLADYMAEIDAGRPVIIHLESHSMLGFGYDSSDPSTIYIDDTWDAGTQTMTWGAAYSGMDHYGVTVIELEQHDEVIPEPVSLIFFGTGLVGVCYYSRKRKQRR